jgi:hypothetical protein
MHEMKMDYRVLWLLSLMVAVHLSAMRLGQVIEVPAIGESGGKVVSLGFGPYSKMSSFCRHTDVVLPYNEIWNTDKVCACAVNKRDAHGNTLLHYSFMEGNEKLITFLRNRGAICSIPNAEGKTASDILLDPLYAHKDKEPMKSWIGICKAEDIASRAIYLFNSFHALVTAEKLDDALFADINELKKNRVGINWHDIQGLTPLHRLDMRPDATIMHVKGLIACGADPLWRTNSFGSVYLGENAHNVGIKIGGRSPIEGLTQQSIYYTNRELMDYIFRWILSKKLVAAMAEEIKMFGSNGQFDKRGFSFTQPVFELTLWPTATEDEARELLRRMK